MKNTGKQKVLALVFAMVFVLGFGVVWVTATYYESNNVSETLFISDSNTKFINVSVSDNYIYSDDTSIETHARSLKGVVMNHTGLTPAYLGNNSWGINCPAYADIPYILVDYYLQIELPNMENWIITNVKINTSLDESEKYDWGCTFLHFNAPFPLTTYGSASTPTAETNVFKEYNEYGAYDKNISIDLADALKIYDNSQNKEYTSVEFGFEADNPLLSLDAFAFTFTVEIEGYKQATNSLETMLTWGLIGSIIINISVIILMTDSIDIGGYIRDIPKKRRS